MAGFPNLFFLVGPNTGLGHTSIVFMIESQVSYVVDALRTMRRRGARTVDVRPEAQAAYNAELDRMTRGTVWVSGGCSSYYIDRNGRNATIWPTFTWPFRQRTREFDEAAYALGRARACAGPRQRRVAAQLVRDPRRPARLDPDHGAGPVGAVLAGRRDERRLQVPVAAVDEPRARQRRPLRDVVAGQRPGAVGVAEQHVLGVRGERVGHARHRQQAGAAQLRAAQLRLERADAEPVQRSHGRGDGDAPEQQAADGPVAGGPAPGRARQLRPARQGGARTRPPPGPRGSRRSALPRPRSRPPSRALP